MHKQNGNLFDLQSHRGMVRFAVLCAILTCLGCGWGREREVLVPHTVGHKGKAFGEPQLVVDNQHVEPSRPAMLEHRQTVRFHGSFRAPDDVELLAVRLDLVARVRGEFQGFAPGSDFSNEVGMTTSVERAPDGSHTFSGQVSTSTPGGIWNLADPYLMLLAVDKSHAAWVVLEVPVEFQ